MNNQELLISARSKLAAATPNPSALYNTHIHTYMKCYFLPKFEKKSYVVSDDRPGTKRYTTDSIPYICTISTTAVTPGASPVTLSFSISFPSPHLDGVRAGETLGCDAVRGAHGDVHNLVLCFPSRSVSICFHPIPCRVVCSMPGVCYIHTKSRAERKRQKVTTGSIGPA